MKRKHRFVLCITLFVYLFSIFSYPKKAEAIGGEIALWLGGSAATGSTTAAIGTAIGVLGVAGLVVASGAGLYYLGKELYNHWYDDRILNPDGSVTVNDAFIESTQHFIDGYNPVETHTIPGQLKYTGSVMGKVNTMSNGSVISVPFDSLYITGFSTSQNTEINPGYNFKVMADSTGTIKFIYTFVINGVKQMTDVEFNRPAFANQLVSVTTSLVQQFWFTGASSMDVRAFHDIVTPSGTYQYGPFGVSVPWTNTTENYGKSIIVGVQSVDGYPINPKEYDSGSISLDAPVLNNTGSISAQRVVDTYGNDAIIYTPKEWVQTVPMNPSISLNPSIVVPGTIPAVQEVSDPITYPVEENPSIPGDVPYVPDLTVPGSVSLDFSPLYINLKDKFPFSLPWDISNLVSTFRVEAAAPKFHVVFSKDNFVGGGEFEMDFSKFSKLAAILRFFILISFIIGLIKLTRTIIGG